MEQSDAIIYMPSNDTYALEEKIQILEQTIKNLEALYKTLLIRVNTLENKTEETDDGTSADVSANEEHDLTTDEETDDGTSADVSSNEDSDLTTDEEECVEDSEEIQVRQPKYERLRQQLIRRKQEEECIIM
jgi:hypothetical protein